MKTRPEHGLIRERRPATVDGPLLIKMTKNVFRCTSLGPSGRVCVALALPVFEFGGYH